jgi:hypothetical protein
VAQAGSRLREGEREKARAKAAQPDKDGFVPAAATAKGTRGGAAAFAQAEKDKAKGKVLSNDNLFAALALGDDSDDE